MMTAESNEHFVLVHGGCHGAWSWYKLSTLLTSAGHQVMAIDLAVCGVHPKRINKIGSFHDYTQSLMDLMASLLPHKRVILVGYSFGGVVLSLAMERFPEKISVAIFATAMMPSLASPPSIIVKEVHLYKLIKSAGITYISIGHRGTLYNYHSRILRISKLDSGNGSQRNWHLDSINQSSTYEPSQPTL